jgi:hypothetical protein
LQLEPKDERNRNRQGLERVLSEDGGRRGRLHCVFAAALVLIPPPFVAVKALTMKLTFKNLQQQTFTMEVDEKSTVSSAETDERNEGEIHQERKKERKKENSFIFYFR